MSDQAASIAVARVAWSARMSREAVSCSASVTIRASMVVARTAEAPLCRLVHLRAWACSAPSAKMTSPASGCSTSPAKVRIALVAGGVAHLEVPGDPGDVEGGDRDGEGQ